TFSLQADVATVLNLSQDHLDWHRSMQAYAADKARIFGAGTIRVLNRDDPAVMAMASPLTRVQSFGSQPPDEAACAGLSNESGMQWLVLASAADDGEPRRRKQDAEPVPVMINRLMPVDALRIRGTHN